MEGSKEDKEILLPKAKSLTGRSKEACEQMRALPLLFFDFVFLLLEKCHLQRFFFQHSVFIFRFFLRTERHHHQREKQPWLVLGAQALMSLLEPMCHGSSVGTELGRAAAGRARSTFRSLMATHVWKLETLSSFIPEFKPFKAKENCLEIAHFNL